MKMMILMTTLFLALGVKAQVLLAPTGFQSTAVLPKGVRNVMITGFYTEIYDKMDNFGNPEGVAAAFNRSIRWRDVLDGLPQETTQDIAAKGKVKTMLNNNGLSEDDLVGQTFGGANVAVSMQAPVIAMGINENWTVGMAIPVVTQDVSAEKGFVVAPSTEDFTTSLATQGFEEEAVDITEKFQDPIQDKVTSMGYKPIRSNSTTNIGDIRLQSRYQYVKFANGSVLLTQGVVIPTGRRKDINDLTDIGTGQGQWDISAGAVVSYKPLNDSQTVNFGMEYVAQLPLNQRFGADVVDMRIPEAAGEALTPDVDSNVSRDIGDVISGSLNYTAEVYEGLTLAMGGSVQFKYEDRYVGGKYASERYSYLEQGTEVYLESMTLGLEYSTIPLFLQKKVKVPFKAGLAYGRVLGGRNTYDDDIYGFNMSVFF